RHFVSVPPTITFLHTTEVVDMHEPPTKALRDKPNSSMNKGLQLLAEGKIDAFISAGNTGAMMVGVFYTIRAIEGVQRPTISTVIPKVEGGYGLILDVGMQADCKPENLLQNAILGSIYAQNILEIENPAVGLINIGEEEGKGNLLAQAAYPLLKESKLINFIGNIEGREILTGKADVMVCDGFTGNVILKLGESIFDISRSRNLEEDDYFKRFNFETYGGTPILGIDKPVIVGHGISTSRAFFNMINLASKMIETKLLEKMKARFVSEEEVE
ncbi:MAG: phosphate acyltransferase, partial [Chitinophagaceae bacterium]|nr:phosphate acyltransferase [Chitinophagaceae bacterium]